jgi:hypothetical protein
MIDKEAFKQAWRRLAVRFRHEIGDASGPASADSAAMYHEYLSELMDTEAFLAAAQAIWATAKWFPRPADFLTVSAAAEWPLVLQAASEYRPPDATWHQTWQRLTPRTQDVVRRLGGIDAVRAQMERSTLKLREAYLAAYEEGATAEALALPAPKLKAIAGGAP